MQPVLILGVAHTGTNFATELVRGTRKNVDSLALRLSACGASKLLDHDSYCTLRIGDCSDAALRDLCVNCCVVVPVRSPATVALSWVARGSNLEQMFSAWDQLLALAADFEFCYLPLDSGARDEYLAALSAKLGTELKTAWEPVGSFKSTRTVGPEYAQRLAALGEREFFRRLYA